MTLSTDIAFRSTPVTSLLESLLQSGEYARLGFISTEAVKFKSDIKSPLENSLNAELSSFLYSLGKSDAKSQQRLIASFQKRLEAAENEYKSLYAKNSRLYVSFGVFSGAVIVLVLI